MGGGGGGGGGMHIPGRGECATEEVRQHHVNQIIDACTFCQ